MKILSLHMNNIRSHKDTSMEFGKVNFIYGYNGAGKSSIKQALKLALTGESDNGRGLQNYRQFQTESCFVETKVDKLGTIRRGLKKSPSLRLNSTAVTDNAIQQEMFSQCGVTPEMINIAFDYSGFASMSPKEIKDTLFHMSGITLNLDTICKYMDKPSDETVKVLSSIIAGRNTISLDDLDNILDQVITTKRELSHKIDDLNNRLIALGPKPIEPSETKLITEELNLIEADRQKLIKLSADIQTRAQLCESIELDKSHKKSYEEQLTQKFAAFVSCNATSLAKTEATIKKADECIAKRSGEVTSSTAQIKRISTMLERLKGKACPLCETLVCSTDRSELKSILETDLKTNQSLLADAEKNLAAARTFKAEKEKWVKQYQDFCRIKEIISLLSEEISNKEKNLSKYPTDKSDTVTKQMDTLGQKSNELHAKLAVADGYTKWIKGEKSINEDLSQTTGMLKIYEYLTKELSPTGIRSRILQKVIAPVIDACNKKLNLIMPGYSVQIDFEAKAGIILLNEYGIIPLESASKGERIIIYILLQDVINQLNGCGILVLDDLGNIDSKNLKLLMSLIAEMDHYDSIFILHTELIPDIRSYFDEISIFEVDNGTVTRI